MGNIDLVLIFLYVLCFIRVKSATSFVALFLFAVSINVVSYDYSYITNSNYDYLIFCVIYSLLCLVKDKYIKLSALAMVVFYYIMSWDYYLNPTTETMLYNVYPYVTIMLNLTLMLTITRGLQDGFYNADYCWYNDSKFNKTHRKIV